MYAKNFLVAGQFVEMMPIGMPIVLKYDARGVLTGVYSASNGVERDSEDVLPIYKNLLDSHICKNTISVKNTDTYIYGVIVAKDKFTFNMCGMSENLATEYISYEMLNHPETIDENFSIYCGYATSTSKPFNGVANMRQWLNMQGFNTLPGFIVPSDCSDKVIDTLYQAQNKFGDNQVMKYLMFDNKDDSVEVKDLRLLNIVVDSVDKVMDSFGHILCSIKYYPPQNDTTDILVPYYDCHKFNVTSGAKLIFNWVLKKIMYSEFVNKVTDTLICPICGNTYKISNPTVACTDEHCMSTRWTDTNHFLATYNLPKLSGEDYIGLVKDHILQDLCNIFDLEQYKDVHLDSTLFTLIRALIPSYTGIRDRDISGFVQRCSNSIPSINYALNNFENFKARNKDWATECISLCRWLEDDYNVLELKTLFSIDNIHIIQADKLFNGTPMFTDRHIVVTGDFIHGSYQDISAIIKSYNGTISNVYNPDATYVVVGGEHSNIDGKIIQLARKNDIPVIEELDFFNKFGIDEDLKANLV